MAEAIGLASGLLTLATVAFQSSIALYQTLKSIQYHPKHVRDLQDELDDLTAVLRSLADTVKATTDIDLSALTLPLLRCGNACQEFEQEIEKCSSRSGGNRTSFRDWAKLRYMGDDINGFRQQISSYKSTINISLVDATLRKSSLTAESVEGYKDLVQTTTDDLKAHLQSVDERLQSIFGRAVSESDTDTQELRRVKEERLATQKCVEICTQLTDHIDRLLLAPTRGSSSTESDESEGIPERITNEGLLECKNVLLVNAAKLEQHRQELIDRLIRKSKTVMTSAEDNEDLSRLGEELQTTRHCIDICSKADTYVRENTSTIDNYGTGDAIQFLVSNNGKVIHGKNRGVGWRTRQVGGYLNDESIQQISRDFSNISHHIPRYDTSSSEAIPASVPGDDLGKGPSSDFKRYGPGFKLASKSTADSTTSPAISTESRTTNSPKP